MKRERLAEIAWAADVCAEGRGQLLRACRKAEPLRSAAPGGVAADCCVNPGQCFSTATPSVGRFQLVPSRLASRDCRRRRSRRLRAQGAMSCASERCAARAHSQRNILCDAMHWIGCSSNLVLPPTGTPALRGMYLTRVVFRRALRARLRSRYLRRHRLIRHHVRADRASYRSVSSQSERKQQLTSRR